MPDLIAIGEPLVEMAAESAGRLGDVDRFRCGWGGDTANFVLAAARLGGACGYVTRVGQDSFGRAFVAMLETHGVDARHVSSPTRITTPASISSPIRRSGNTGSTMCVAARRRAISQERI